MNDDEEGIKKLVLEVFSKLWFTPIEETNDPADFKRLIESKTKIVTDVVAHCPDVEWLQDLLKGLIKGQTLFFFICQNTGAHIRTGQNMFLFHNWTGQKIFDGPA